MDSEHPKPGEVREQIAKAKRTEVLTNTSKTRAQYIAEMVNLYVWEYSDTINNTIKNALTFSFVPILFLLVLSWLVFVAFCVLSAAYGWWGFSLSPNVLIALITSTTATVIGLFHYVAKWLYHLPPIATPDKKEKEE